MTIEHTPGPWPLVETKQDNVVSHWHVQIGDCEVSFFPYKRIYSDDRKQSGLVVDHQRMADARLFSAAPELLAALEYIKNTAVLDKKHLEVIGVALAKAKGAQP